MNNIITRKKPVIGVFAVAHKAYWKQFPGLFEKLLGYHSEFTAKLDSSRFEIVDASIIDSSEAAFETAKLFNSAGVDLVFCNMITYATSSVFAPVLRNVNAPIVLTALQPRDALDYRTANTFMQLENDNICSVPEFCGVAERLGKPITDIIIGTLAGDEEADREIAGWCSVACALSALKGARIGLMGHVLEAMYDMHTDPTAIFNCFGLHVPLLEIDDLIREYEKVSDEEMKAEEELIKAEFDMPEPKSDPLTMKLTDKDLTLAARCSVALRAFRDEYRLDGLAYYYSGSSDSLARTIASSLIVGNSLLIAQGTPMCGEYDIKTCIAMLIMDSMGMGGSFAEIHPFDFSGDFILVGHDGPHHVKIAEGKPVLRSLKAYHGKEGSGASVEFKLREGPITMLGINQKRDGSFKFVIGEGMSNAGAIPPTGNTNTRTSFLPDTKTFIKKWCLAAPTHHFALGIGHRGEELCCLARALGIEYEFVK